MPAEALGTLVKPSDKELTSSVWTWKENEYYSAVFTYDTESLLPAAPDTYSIVYTAGGQDTTEYAISAGTEISFSPTIQAAVKPGNGTSQQRTEL